MGTHPIFESDFDCLTEHMGRTIRGVKKEREAERKRRTDRQWRENQTDAEYEIEEIVDSKAVYGGATLYFVKWKGYPDSDNTWESEGDLPTKIKDKYNRSLEPKVPKKAASLRSPKKSKVIKSPAKAETPTLTVTNRIMRYNVVYYQVKGRRNPIPIFEFDDMTPVKEFERNCYSTENLTVERIPVEIVEKKGKKYLIRWEEGPETWETVSNTDCAEMIEEFNNREFDESDDETYEVKAIVGKRKAGRIYEYEVHWKGHSEEENTWEAEESLVNCREKIDAFNNAAAQKMDKQKAAKREKRQNADPNGEAKSRGRPKKRRFSK